MEPLHLFSLVSQQTNWLAARQSVISRNISNVNTPGFRAQDLQPFEDMLNHTNLSVKTTQTGHIGLSPSEDLRPNSLRSSGDDDMQMSGNSVDLAQEMSKTGDINRAFSIDTSIAKSFQKMLLSVAKA